MKVGEHQLVGTETKHEGMTTACAEHNMLKMLKVRQKTMADSDHGAASVAVARVGQSVSTSNHLIKLGTVSG